MGRSRLKVFPGYPRGRSFPGERRTGSFPHTTVRRRHKTRPRPVCVASLPPSPGTCAMTRRSSSVRSARHVAERVSYANEKIETSKLCFLRLLFILFYLSGWNIATWQNALLWSGCLWFCMFFHVAQCRVMIPRRQFVPLRLDSNVKIVFCIYLLTFRYLFNTKQVHI